MAEYDNCRDCALCWAPCVDDIDVKVDSVCPDCEDLIASGPNTLYGCSYDSEITQCAFCGLIKRCKDLRTHERCFKEQTEGVEFPEPTIYGYGIHGVEMRGLLLEFIMRIRESDRSAMMEELRDALNGNLDDPFPRQIQDAIQSPCSE